LTANANGGGGISINIQVSKKRVIIEYLDRLGSES
jgi:hypothetical protein